MKRVKIMLAGIAVLGIIGGALAFKAKTAYGIVVFYTKNTSTSCNIEGINYTTTTLQSPAFPTQYRITVAGKPTTCTNLGFLTTKS